VQSQSKSTSVLEKEEPLSCCPAGACLTTILLLTLLFPSAGLWVMSRVDAQAASSADKLCVPPNYCARTDRRIVAYPDTPPSLGPAGSIVKDPNFGSRVVRVTDDKTDAKRRGGSLMTPSSSEQNTWNTSSTAFYVFNSGGGFILYDFDPSTMMAHSLGAPPVNWAGEPQFSYSQTDILYGVDRRNRAFQQYDLSNRRLTTIHKVSDCLKLNALDTGHDVSASADDSRLLAVLGPRQDDNYIVYVFDRGRGCRWYDTQTGEIGGQWGPKGVISIPDRYGVHNSRMSKSGKFVYITRGRGSQGKWLVWEVETTNVVACTSLCSGHHVMGYSHIVGPSGQSHPFDLVARPLNRLDASSHLITGLQRTGRYWYDHHFSWNNVNLDDTNPVCLSTYRPSNPNTPRTPLAVNGPWENEVVCIEMDGKDSKVWRFAHTYSTAKNGFWSQPRGNVSQDGRFFMFTSDWEDQLGQTPNGKYRTDVFIIELR
jgi:hypothetical protein